MTGLDQANRVIDALFANLDHYRAIFKNENNILQKTFDGCMKSLKRLRNMPKRSNDSDEQSIELERELEELKDLEAKLHKEKETLNRLRNKFHQKFTEINAQAVRDLRGYFRVDSGLSPARIQMFQLFTANETHVNDQCSICLEDVNVGRRMRRLTCDGQHYFCQECIEGWFAEHNTCPLCRHKFD